METINEKLNTYFESYGPRGKARLYFHLRLTSSAHVKCCIYCSHCKCFDKQDRGVSYEGKHYITTMT